MSFFSENIVYCAFTLFISDLLLRCTSGVCTETESPQMSTKKSSNQDLCKAKNDGQGSNVLHHYLHHSNFYLIISYEQLVILQSNNIDIRDYNQKYYMPTEKQIVCILTDSCNCDCIYCILYILYTLFL